jgi:preprotein translocase subunit SecD
MLKRLTFFILTAAALAWASGLPEVYEPKPEPKPKPKPPEVEKKPRVEKPSGREPGAELYDVRVILAVGGAAETDIAAATAKLLPILERRASQLARRHALERGPGEGRITVELFDCPDPARALEILTAPGLLELQAVAERDIFVDTLAAAGWPAERLLPYEHGNVILVAASDRLELIEKGRGALKAGERVVWTRKLEAKEGDVYKAAFATGDGMAVTSAVDAAVVTGAGGEPEVYFDLSERDGTIFSGLTARHVGEALAVVFDDELFYTARVKEQTFKSGRIVGELDEARAADIALLLSSGSLPATLTPLEYYVDGESRPIPQPSK